MTDCEFRDYNLCEDQRKLYQGVVNGKVDKDLADQDENLCSSGFALESGTLFCKLRDQYLVK